VYHRIGFFDDILMVRS